MLTKIDDRRETVTVRAEQEVTGEKRFNCQSSGAWMRRPMGLDERKRMIDAMDRFAEKGDWFVVETECGRLKFTSPIFFPAKRMNEWAVECEGAPAWWPKKIGGLTGHLTIDWNDDRTKLVLFDDGPDEHVFFVGNVYSYTLGKQE